MLSSFQTSSETNDTNSAENTPLPDRPLKSFQLELISHFSILDQIIEPIRMDRANLDADRFLDLLDQLVQTNVRFAERHLESCLDRLDNEWVLHQLQQFNAATTNLRKLMSRSGWFVFQRPSVLHDPVIRKCYTDTMNQSLEIIRGYFQMFGQVEEESRPAKMWVEIAAGFWVELSKWCRTVEEKLQRLDFK